MSESRKTVDPATKIVEAVGADPVVQAAVEHANDPLVAAGARATVVATELETSLRTESQRAINLIWETTQMRAALSVIWGSLVVASVLAMFGKWLGSPDLQLAAVVFLFGVANLVTGFYFGRTNHARTGGVGGDTARHDR